MMNRLSDNRRILFVCLFLAITAIAIYWQVNHCDFTNYDDNLYVTENSHIKNGITTEGIRWAFTTSHTGNWHPLTWISHMLDCQLFGLRPGLHHLVNLFFHMVNTLLLFLILHRMTKGLWQSAFVSAVFAIHPLHVESVAWVAERKDVLSTFFWMLTMGAYVFYVERRELRRYLLTLSFFALGLMAKPMLVTLPFVLLLLDYWPLRRLTIRKSSVNEHTQSDRSLNRRSKRKERRRSGIEAKHANKTERQIHELPAIWHIILEKIPFFVLSLASSIVTYMAQQTGDAVGSLQSFPLSARVANALVSYCGYIGKMGWPADLAVLYPYPGMPPIWEVVVAVFFLGITTFFIIRNVIRLPYLTTGWLWYLGTLVPVIGLVKVGVQAMADRYTYVPLIGISIMAAWGAPELFKKWRNRSAALAVLTVITLSIFSYATWKQLGYWQNSVTLFRHTLDVTTNNYVALNNFGVTLQEQGRLEEAINHYSEALRIKPAYADAHNSLGTALQEQGRLEEAINHYSEALRIKPACADAHNNLGTALQEQGRIEEAMAHYAEAIRISPSHFKAHDNIGDMLILRGKIDEAISHYTEAIRINPDYIKGYVNLGEALALQGKFSEAITLCYKALNIKPNSVEIHYNLGTLHAYRGEIDEAIYHFRECVRIKPDFAKAHNNLGNVLLNQGRLDEAIASYREALRLKPNYTIAQKNLKIALAEQRKSR